MLPGFTIRFVFLYPLWSLQKCLNKGSIGLLLVVLFWFPLKNQVHDDRQRLSCVLRMGPAPCSCEGVPRMPPSQWDMPPPTSAPSLVFLSMQLGT